MLKKISFFALAALIFVGCNSNEEEKEKKRSHKDASFAFINSHPNIVGYGRLNVNAIMDEGNIEQVGIFQLIAGETYNAVKKQVDINEPVYIATTTTEGHTDLTAYAIFKLKSEKAMHDFWTESGYEFEKHKGIQFAEDEGLILAAKDNIAMMILIPGDFDGKKVVAKAFKSTRGKIATGEMKKRLEAKGDFVLHMNAEDLKINDPSLAMLIPDDTEVDIVMDFSKGEMVLESKVNNYDKVKSKYGIEATDEPYFAKKVVDDEGNLIMAMQLNAKSNTLEGMGMKKDDLDKAMNLAPLMVEDQDVSLNIVDIEEGEEILMPSGDVMGSEFFEVTADLDAVIGMIPEYQEYEEYWSRLNTASITVKDDGTMRLVVTSDEKGQNFLATVSQGINDFMSNGGMQMLLGSM